MQIFRYNKVMLIRTAAKIFVFVFVFVYCEIELLHVVEDLKILPKLAFLKVSLAKTLLVEFEYMMYLRVTSSMVRR